ncbi:hypothetical protein IC575_024861 [Cucumis melo]
MLLLILFIVISFDISMASNNGKIKSQETGPELPEPHEPLVTFHKFNIRIYNELQMYLLDSHCYSKDDDLGTKVLYPNDEQSWSFRGNWLGTTNFHCKLEWENGYLEFDAFSNDVKFLTNFCAKSSCCWSARQDGVYLTNQNGQVVFNQNWEMIRT